MTTPRVLVAGIGNIFLGDDAFGVEVIRRFAQRPLPPEVRVVDYGIRGFDLAYAFMDDYDTVLLVDALPRGGPPGTLYVLEPDLNALDTGDSELPLATHGMDPMKVLGLVKMLGGTPRSIRVLGCEPATFGSDEDPALALSPPVAAAVDEAVAMLENLVNEALKVPIS